MDDDDENKETQSQSKVPSSAQQQTQDSWSAWGSWGQGWIDTVKEKSAQTMQMVKKDLNEFVEVIQGDTSTAMSETASKIKEDDKNHDEKSEDNSGEVVTIESATKVVKKGVANFLQSVSELMALPPDDSKDEVITVSDFSTSSQYNRRQEKLHAIQVDPGTYCNEPEGLFVDWLEVFNLDDNKLDMSNMLVQNPAVRAIYTQLVPAVVSHTMFWQRYYYQVFLLDAEEKKREAIVARASNGDNEDDNESGWGDDDDDDGIEVLVSSTSTKTNVMDYSIITNDKVIETNTKDNLLSVDISTIETDDDSEVVINECSEDQVSAVVENTSDVTTVVVNTSDVTTVDENLTDATGVVENTSNSTTVAEIDDSNENITELENQEKHHFETPLSKENEKSELTRRDEQLSDDQMLEVSSDVIDISCNVETESDNETIQGNTDDTKVPQHPTSPQISLISNETLETSSVGSWMSIDDVIKVKKISGEQQAKLDSNGTSANVSTDSNGVMVNKSDIVDESDEDFDIDIDDDVNDEEVAKMVEEIKNMATGGTLDEDDDDDDWENWE